MFVVDVVADHVKAHACMTANRQLTIAATREGNGPDLHAALTFEAAIVDGGEVVHVHMVTSHPNCILVYDRDGKQHKVGD